jgi:hypothetical protein
MVQNVLRIEKIAKVSNEQGMENVVKELVDRALMNIEEFFNYCEANPLDRPDQVEEKILFSLNNNGKGDSFNIKTLYKNLTKREKEYIVTNFNSLLEYSKRFDADPAGRFAPSSKRQEWCWKRPKLNSSN